MICDYEAAWLELGAFVGEKSQHGRHELLTEMVAIAARHRVPAGEKSRLLRLYGVEVERARAISEQGPADVSSSGEDEFLVGTGASRGIIDHDPGGHDHDVRLSNGSGGGRD